MEPHLGDAWCNTWPPAEVFAHLQLDFFHCCQTLYRSLVATRVLVIYPVFRARLWTYLISLCYHSSLLFRSFMDRISRCSHGVGVVGLVTSGLGLYFFQTTWSCWLHQAVTTNSCWIGLQLGVNWLGWEIWGHCSQQGKGWSALSGSGRRSCLKFRSSSTLESCLWVREWWSGTSTGRLLQRLQ